MRYLLVFTLILPLLLTAQTDKVYTLDISDQKIDLNGLSFRIGEVMDETGVTDGRFGTVYTGLLNNGRDVTIQNGIAMNFKSALVRNTTQAELPAANLAVRFLRLSEELTPTSERRRLQLEAMLEMPGTDGDPVRYGPRIVTRVEGGIDVTGGHPAALADVLSELLHLLDEDLQNGVAADPLAGGIKPAELPNGAFYSVADYRAGRVDAGLSLERQSRNLVYRHEGTPFFRAAFDRPAEVSRSDVRELWGYHHEGVSYLYIQRNFYSIQEDAEGTTLVAIPGGITDPEAMTKQAAIGGLLLGAIGGAIAGSIRSGSNEEFFQLDLNSGALLPRPGTEQSVSYADRILLHNIASVDTPEMLAALGGKQYRLGPGQFADLDGAGELTVGFDGQQEDSREYKIWGTEGRPALYILDINKKGKITLVRGSDEQAKQAAQAAADGEILPAR
ncbi:MAG: hypothetical protein WA952_04075 [Lewinella sp.]